LLGVGLRLDRVPTAIPDAVALRELRDLGAHGLRVLGSEVRTTGVEPLVVVELPGVVARERLEEMLSRPGP
jgi:hypothetical protein